MLVSKENNGKNCIGKLGIETNFKLLLKFNTQLIKTKSIMIYSRPDLLFKYVENT